MLSLMGSTIIKWKKYFILLQCCTLSVAQNTKKKSVVFYFRYTCIIGDGI